jgi:hypothetical protein
MFPLLAVILPDFSRGEAPRSGVARAYAATRMKVEAPPVGASEAGVKSRGRRPGERRPSASPDEPDTGHNLDIEV